MSKLSRVWRVVGAGLLLFTPANVSAQAVRQPLPRLTDDSSLAATMLSSGVLSGANVRRPLLAFVRSSAVTAQGDRIGIVLARTNIDDADVAALFVNRGVSRPALRGTAVAPQLGSGAVEAWNEFVSGAKLSSVPADSQTSVALSLLFLSFGTGRFVPLPRELGESVQWSGRSGDAITRTQVGGVTATCEGSRCRVAGTWHPVPGVALPFLIVVREGGLVELGQVQLPFGTP